MIRRPDFVVINLQGKQVSLPYASSPEDLEHLVRGRVAPGRTKLINQEPGRDVGIAFVHLLNSHDGQLPVTPSISDTLPRFQRSGQRYNMRDLNEQEFLVGPASNYRPDPITQGSGVLGGEQYLDSRIDVDSAFVAKGTAFTGGQDDASVDSHWVTEKIRKITG